MPVPFLGSNYTKMIVRLSSTNSKSFMLNADTFLWHSWWVGPEFLSLTCIIFMLISKTSDTIDTNTIITTSIRVSWTTNARFDKRSSGTSLITATVGHLWRQDEKEKRDPEFGRSYKMKYVYKSCFVFSKEVNLRFLLYFLATHWYTLFLFYVRVCLMH